MRTPANLRIQWLHDEISHGSYPNASRLAEKFHISHRQAQRDIDYLKKQLEAPLLYDQRNQGYRYTAPFALPLVVVGENDDLYTYTRTTEGVSRQAGAKEGLHLPDADNVVIQSQIPYTATLDVSDKLTVLELRDYIISTDANGQYLCEFHHIDRFLCSIFTSHGNVRIVEPDWLRQKLLRMADKALRANSDDTQQA